jgi:PII-like signaling protein
MNADAQAGSPQTGHLEIVRIYFKRLHLKRRRSSFFWKLETGQPAAVALAKEALDEGMTFALVTLGAAGFVHGAKHLELNMGEVACEGLPTCLELVGPMRRIRKFLEARKVILADAIVLRMEGEVVLMGENGGETGQ